MDWDECVINGTATIRCIEPLIANIIQAVVALGAVALFVMLLVGGFNFLFAGGDQKKFQQAQATVTQAIVGLAIMSLAYLIIKTIETFTGVNVTEFRFPEL